MWIFECFLSFVYEMSWSVQMQEAHMTVYIVFNVSVLRLFLNSQDDIKPVYIKKTSHNGVDRRREQLYLLLWMEINAPLWCCRVICCGYLEVVTLFHSQRQWELSGTCVEAQLWEKEEAKASCWRETVWNRQAAVYCCVITVLSLNTSRGFTCTWVFWLLWGF